MIPQIEILDAIADRLAIIKKVNGYYTDVVSIKRATMKPLTDDDLPAINYWASTDDQLAKGHGWVDRQLSVVIEFYQRTRDRAFTDVVFELASDVAIAMIRDPDNPLATDDPDLTLGGLVRSSQLNGITPQIGEGQAPWCGAVLNYSLIYRVSATNPLTLIP